MRDETKEVILTGLFFAAAIGVFLITPAQLLLAYVLEVNGLIPKVTSF